MRANESNASTIKTIEQSTTFYGQTSIEKKIELKIIGKNYWKCSKLHEWKSCGQNSIANVRVHFRPQPINHTYVSVFSAVDYVPCMDSDCDCECDWECDNTKKYHTNWIWRPNAKQTAVLHLLQSWIATKSITQHFGAQFFSILIAHI